MQSKFPFKTLALSLSFALSTASFALAPLSGASAAPAAKTAKTAEKAEKAEKGADTAKATDKAADKTAEKPDAKKEPTRPEPVIENIVNVQAETLVDHPNEYLNKNVRFTGMFSGYNSLALDYKPALRSAKDYLSFSILRDHSKVPLSELKMAMKNPKDEKDPSTKLLLKLKEKDEIEVIGKVFATPLDEPWVDVLKLKLIKEAPDDKKADAGSTTTK
ncbi:MAG: hypothetical protein KGS72_03050 [Cyanobacteria bacterium REEB67]|nr:hypothetical protein [Cyanobacteria bacterium REEB67]